MKYPVRLRWRGEVKATIYKPTKHYPLYRVAWHQGGKRQMKALPTYSAAKHYGDDKVKELAKDLPFLTPGQMNDALAAFARLKDYCAKTGRPVTLPTAVSQFCEAAEKSNGMPLPEMAEGFQRTVATVTRIDLGKAVEEFITGEEPKTKSMDGKRPQVNPKYHYNRAIMLRRLAGHFLNTAVCGLSKGLLDKFFTDLGKLKSNSRNGKPVKAPKSRNHYRAAVRQFLDWSVCKDYLPATHRLHEAVGLKLEKTDMDDPEFYTPEEFARLLENAEGDIEPGRRVPETMRAMIAIGGLAGVRTAELLRLDWEDLRRVPGHIELSARIAKKSQRRLVEIVPALAAWLSQYHQFKSGKLWTLHECMFQQYFGELCDKAKVQRKMNGLRHSFCTYHYALYENEYQTAKQAGHSPQMLKKHYDGRATKQVGQQWFAVEPPQAAQNVVHLATANGGAA